MELIRINKRIAQTGMYSRREADKLIFQGRVTYNGVKAEAGTQVPVGGGDIKIDGIPLGVKMESVFKFHKPVGVLSSYHDPNGKKNLSAFACLSDKKLGYSGRLDYDSEGLMLFTSDGDLIQKIQKSEFSVDKEYLVDVKADITNDWIRALEKGIKDKEEQFLPCKVIRVAEKKYKVILTEGKKRQVRRMFKAAGSLVLRLQRVRIANVNLGNLKPGELKELSKAEIESLHTYIDTVGKY